MKKQGLQIDLFPTQKRKVAYLKDHEMIVGEFRAYYKPHPNGNNQNSKIKSSSELYEYLKPIYADCIEDSEQFVVVYLSQSNNVLHYTIASTGGITSTLVDIQLILRHAILLNAKGIILSHNHPSGNTQPSEADMKMTRKLANASKLMDITVLDHIILVASDYYSFADNGEM